MSVEGFIFVKILSFGLYAMVSHCIIFIRASVDTLFV
jgi:hypothetical protein